MTTDEWRVDTSDIVHAIATGATNRQVEFALGVDRATVARIRNARRRRIRQLRALHSDAATIKRVHAQDLAAIVQAQTAESETQGSPGTEQPRDLAPPGWMLCMDWMWITGTLRIAGETAFKSGANDTEWRSCWHGLAGTSERAEIAVSAFQGEGIDALLRAAPREGDVLRVRNAPMIEDWIWSVCPERGTTVENLGAGASMTKPIIRGTTSVQPDISGWLLAETPRAGAPWDVDESRGARTTAARSDNDGSDSNLRRHEPAHGR